MFFTLTYMTEPGCADFTVSDTSPVNAACVLCQGAVMVPGLPAPPSPILRLTDMGLQVTTRAAKEAVEQFLTESAIVKEMGRDIDHLWSVCLMRCSLCLPQRESVLWDSRVSVFSDKAHSICVREQVAGTTQVRSHHSRPKCPTIVSQSQPPACVVL